MGDARDRVNRALKCQATCLCRQTGRAAAGWATLFAIPHLWWAVGVPMGFPGGAAGLAEALAVSWFVAYDLLVVALSAAAALVAVAALQFRPVGVPLAWGTCVVLLARGVAGLIVDGFADLIWSPMFVVGGLLFGATAWLCGCSPPGPESGSGTGGDAGLP